MWQHYFPIWPPSVNHTWIKGRGRVRLDSKVEAFRRAMALEIMAAKAAGELPCAPLLEPVILVLDFYPPNKQRRDLDNLPKGIEDAFTLGGIWQDDSQVKTLLLRMREPIKHGGFRAKLKVVKSKITEG